ncbi:MAG: ATP-binding protein [Clostridiales bacterium]
MRRYFLLFLLCCQIVFTSVVFPYEGNSFKAKKGILDLSSFDFRDGRLIKLNGQWEFYYGRHFSPKDFKCKDSLRADYIEVPSNWSREKINGRQFPGLGIATYRLRIILPKNLKSKDEINELIGIRLDAVYTAYKLWVNDRLIVEMGKAGKSSTDYYPSVKRFTHYIAPESDTIQIIINVSNFLSPKLAGLAKEIKISSARQIESTNMLSDSFTIFIAGFLCMIFFYHLILYFIRKEEKINLYLSLISLIFSIEIISGGASVIFYFMPFLSTEWSYRIWFFTLNVIPLFFGLLKNVFPNEVSKKVVKPIYVLYAVYSLIDIIFPFTVLSAITEYMLYISILCLVYLFYIIYLVVKRKRRYGIFYLISFSIPILLGINDLAYSLGCIFTGHYSSIGIAVFAAMQSLIISLRFARSYESVLELSSKLYETNDNLEKMVEERTTDLSKANAELITLNKQKDRFLSIVSHDLVNPFNTLLGMTQFLQSTDLEDKEELKSMHDSLYSAAEKVYKLLENLLQWSKIQFFDYRFTSTKVNLNESVEIVSNFLKDRLDEKKVKLVSSLDKTYYIDCDEHSLQTILRNLITNAIKFSVPGKNIIVSAFENQKDIQISIRDFGVGMPEEIREELFMMGSKYQREGTSGEQGSGLGLIIIKELVERNNGTISCTSQEMKGTEFNVTFPKLNN